MGLEEIYDELEKLPPESRGQFIRNLRASSDAVSQDLFAKLVGVGQSTLSKYESSGVIPTVKKLLEIASKAKLSEEKIAAALDRTKNKAKADTPIRVALSHNIHSSAVLVAARQNLYGDNFVFSSTRNGDGNRGSSVPWSKDPLETLSSAGPREAMFTSDWIPVGKRGSADLIVGTPETKLTDDLTELGILCSNKRSTVSVFYKKKSNHFDSSRVKESLNPDYLHQDESDEGPPDLRFRDRFYYRFLRAFNLCSTDEDNSVRTKSGVPIFVRDLQVSAFDFDAFRGPWPKLFRRFDIRDPRDYSEIAKAISQKSPKSIHSASELFKETDMVCVVYWEPFSSYYFKEIEKFFNKDDFLRVDLKSSLFYERRRHRQVPVEIIGNREFLNRVDMDEITRFFEATAQGVEALIRTYEKENTDSQLIRDLAAYFGLPAKKYIRDLKTHLYDMEVMLRPNAIYHYKSFYKDVGRAKA